MSKYGSVPYRTRTHVPGVYITTATRRTAVDFCHQALTIQTQMSVKDVKEQIEHDLLDQDNVLSVGIGHDDDGNEVIIVTVREGKARTLTLPESVDDGQVSVEESDEFVMEVLKEVDTQVARRGRVRPVVGGVSTGHPQVTAGTVGYQLTDGETVYTASNNHVYAAVNKGSPGDSILQPGTADGGTEESKSAELVDYVPIEDGVTVDVAWALPSVQYDNVMTGVGAPEGEPRDPQVGDVIIKSGRTTGVTTGEVQQVNATVNVNFGEAGTIRMENQFITEDMSDGGDSGSAGLFRDSLEPAGHLFAGSSSATVFNYATQVESETGLSIVTKTGDEDPTARVSLTLRKTSPDTGDIVVNVNDNQDNAVEGATVNITGGADDSATTDSQGVARFEDVPIDSYTISAEASGFESDSVTIAATDFQTA